jgi:hypothetical protein
VSLFDLVADPVTGRLDVVGEFDLACGQRFREGEVDDHLGHRGTG